MPCKLGAGGSGIDPVRRKGPPDARRLGSWGWHSPSVIRSDFYRYLI